jgi:hypothetical protein
MTSTTASPPAPSPTASPSAARPRRLRVLFWVCLAAFLAADWWLSPPVDLRSEPPLVAAGSGQAASGGHCSMGAK